MIEIEESIKFDMTAGKAILIDVILLALILCAFFAGFWYGQKQQAEEKIGFFKEYIDDQCTCREKLIFSKDKVIYENEFSPSIFNLSLH